MRYLSYLPLFVILSFFSVSCVNNRSTQKSLDKDSKMLESNLTGIYKGSLPCADCESIETLLTLDSENNFEMNYFYQGKNDRLFQRNGTWKLNNETLILQGVDQQYQVDKSTLWQLDLSGNRIMGALADKYKLMKIK